MRFEDLLKIEKVVDEVNDWRHRPANVYTADGLALVSMVSTVGRELKAAVRDAVDAIGGVHRALSPGDRVLLKPNFNSPDPFPASSDFAFIGAVVEILREDGITDLTLGERCGWPWMPTAEVFAKLGAQDFAREVGIRLINFELGPWMDVRPGDQARWWKTIAYPQALKEFDKIVYLPCLKTHRRAGFTMSLKLTVGLTHPVEMAYMHADFRLGRVDEPLDEKLPELSLAVGPDLIILDGRKAFVTDGPADGELVEPEVILASGDRVALDVEGLKILRSYPRDNQIQGPVWENAIIRRAVELGIGVGSEDAYRLIGKW